MAEALCALGLGSNMGDMAGNLHQAVLSLQSHPNVEVVNASSLYKTPPWGETDQPWFLNAACLIKTDLPPLNLLNLLKSIEQQIGRQARYHWGPREIDLDILSYGEMQLASETLTLPHAHLFNRAFVLVPLAEIAPQMTVLGRTIADEAAGADSAGIEKLGSFWPQGREDAK